MKKTILFISLFLSGCAISNIVADNKNCLSTTEYEVFQALDYGALAHECTVLDGCSVWHQMVYLRHENGIDYYDGLKVSAPSGKCAVQDGVYKYTSKDDRNRTVPAIKFDYKNDAKTDEERLERVGETAENMTWTCKVLMSKDEKTNDAKHMKRCDCATEFLFDYMINGDAYNSIEDLIKKIDKKCGHIPDRFW